MAVARGVLQGTCTCTLQAHTRVPIEGICTPEALTKVLSLSTSSEVTYASNGSWDRSSDS